VQSKFPAIDPRILEQWQGITNLVAELCRVPAALIMRQNDDTMEVMSGSEHPDSPYHAHDKAPLEGDLYCETVIKTQKLLHVPNALKDPVWDHNPDIELGMISYCGVPVNWPDGTPFGTLCILDKVEKHSTNKEKDLLNQFARIIEMTLELLVSNRRYEDMSLKDGLTGIANRRLFDVVLQREWAQSLRVHQPLSLLICDIDFFKKYNDSLGHVQGDRCLKQVAEALTSVSKRELDLCARYGGEEFGILLPNTDAEQAFRLAEQCRLAVADLQIPHPSSSVCNVVTISVGVCTVTDVGDQPDIDLVRAADKALYRAKQGGRNRVEVCQGAL
jgi:diguanylate cyclase (GGDEF)-like protein